METKNNDIHPNNSNSFKKKIIIFIIMLGISLLLVGLGLLWQLSFSFLAIINALYFSGFILFSFGFMIFAANANVFSPLVYGTKTFFLMIFGKKQKGSYFDYVTNISENPISKLYIFYPLAASIPNLIAAGILHYYFNTYIYPTLTSIFI